jgi:glutathione S-transferase
MTLNPPILYSFRRCPYAMRARLALLASSIDYEHREVVLRDKPAAMLAVSPKGTVPVLVLPNGEVIDQSVDIMLWALRQNDPYHWLEHTKDALAVIAQCDGAFKYHLDRYKYPNRFGDVGDTDKVDHRAKASEFADHINALMAQNNYEFNSSLGIYYAGYMPFIRQFSNKNRSWFDAQPWPHLQAAMATFETSAEFKTIMQTYPQWKP